MTLAVAPLQRKKYMKRLPLVVGLFVAIALFTGTSAEAAPDRKTMIGQMLMMGLPSSSAKSAFAKHLAAQISQGEVGGVVLLGHNFKSRAGVESLTKLFRKAAGRGKVFLALDMEGGAVQRLGKKLGYPSIASAHTIARTQSLKQARATFTKLARITRDAGFNMNLGPVVDLLVTPDNPVIARWRRSFSANPETVAKYARAFVKAHRDLGVITVLKHFPGHGSSTTDSHDGFVEITDSWSQAELKPFQQMIASGDAPAIMPGHLIHKTIASDGVPVSISRAAITGLLRKKLKFNGLVVSDDLQMSAIASNYSYKAAVIRAVNAGVDVLMISNSRGADPKLPTKTIAIISQAIDSGKISLATVQAAYRRIVYAKKGIASH